MLDAPPRSTPPLRPLSAVALTLAVALLPSVARGAGGTAGSSAPPGTAPMRAELRRYFDGERSGGIWLVSAGAAAVGLGAGLGAQGSDFARGLGYTILAFGALEAIGGAAFILNTRQRVPRFERQLSGAPRAFTEAELPRIRGVNRDMRLLEKVEIALMIGSAALATAGALQDNDLLAGIGTGVLIESTVLLIYDQLAARRALRYTDQLVHFSAGVSTGAGTAPRVGLLTAAGRF